MAVNEAGLGRVRQLLRTARYAAMATVNEDGSPHNTPYFFLHNPALTKIYWGTHPDSRHSQNVLRTGKLFVVLFDGIDSKGTGLYIEAINGHIAEGAELDEALDAHNSFRARYQKDPLDRAYYSIASPQRMWIAEITGLWTNDAERGPDGHITKDFRQAITAAELIS